MNKQPKDDIFLQAVKFLKGDGVERSVDIASKLFHVAAEAGHDKAQFNLGVMYLNGIGVVKNKLLAIHWLERAVSLGNRQAQHTLEKIKSSTNADVQQKTVLLSGNKITPIVTEVLAAVDTDSIKQGEEKVEPVQRPISASNKDVLISFAFLVLLCYLIWHFILAPLGHFVFGTSGKFLYGQYLSAGNNAIEFFDEKYIDGEVLEEKRTENGRCYFGWIELKSTAVLGQPLISKHTNILYIFTYEQDGRYWTGFRGLNYIDDLRQSWEEYQCGEFPKGRK